MKYLNLISSKAKWILITAVLLILYGYLCRLMDIYFFGESKTIGWLLLCVGLAFVVNDRIKRDNTEQKKSVLQKIWIGSCVFVVLLVIVLYFVELQTDAYKAAVHFININPEIKNKVGTVNNIFIEPFGQLEIIENHNGVEGNANFQFIVKGSKGYLDVHLILNKEYITDWQVEMNK